MRGEWLEKVIAIASDPGLIGLYYNFNMQIDIFCAAAFARMCERPMTMSNPTPFLFQKVSF